MSSEFICIICQFFESDHEKDYFSLAPCGHLFHQACMSTWIIQNEVKASCPKCRANVTLNGMTKVHDVEPQSPKNHRKNERPDKTLKIVLLGDSGTGKSCLTRRYADGVFPQLIESTIAVDFRDKLLEIGGRRVRLRLWDTAGQEKHSSITMSYVRGAHAALIVYDITNWDSFIDLKKWIDFCRETAQTEPVILICGNKVDLVKKRVVSENSGQIYAKSVNVDFMEASAKDGVNVNRIFRHLATLTLDNLDKLEDAKILDSNEYDTINLNVSVSDQRKKSKCCK